MDNINLITVMMAMVVVAYPFVIGKVLTSISESYYYLKTANGKDRSHYFYYYTGVLGVLMLCQAAMPYYKDMARLVFALSGFFLPAISIAANSKEKKQGLYHIIATYASIILIDIGVTIQLWPEDKLWYKVVIACAPTLFIIGSVIALRNNINKTWWIEHAAELAFLASLLIIPK